jgi:pyruvate/2-oxoglutarate dehydrogenase complex dihydrolipoamide dehydrogenase (E3) component
MQENPITGGAEIDSFDVIVIGGGPAGVTAALRASQLGATVALVERDRLGGTCTNDGCVPTRVLAKAARLLRDSDQFATYGLTGPAPELDFSLLLKRTQQVVYQVHEKKQLIKHLEESAVQVFTETGPAGFINPYTIALENGRQLKGSNFILCVGGRPRRLDFPGAEHALTHTDVWTLDKQPRSVAIIGAAATGCQLASIFLSFETQVTLLDIAPHILPVEDAHVSAALAQGFKRRGAEVILGITSVERIEKDGPMLTLTYWQDETSRQITVEAVIMAAGWPGSISGLNLDAAGVNTTGSFIPVDIQLRTNVPHIFAAGDITGDMMLVQSASYEARLAAENAVVGDHSAYKDRIVPHGGFTDPEYGSVGLTEAQAREYYDIAVAVVPYTHLDRAVIDGREEGFCKLIASRTTRRILGAHVVGEQALEVVQILAAGMAAKIRCEELAEIELAYPTYTAIVGMAARKLLGEFTDNPSIIQWGALSQLPEAEWERRDGDESLIDRG